MRNHAGRLGANAGVTEDDCRLIEKARRLVDQVNARRVIAVDIPAGSEVIPLLSCALP